MDARLYYKSRPNSKQLVEELSVVSLLRGMDVPPAGHLPEGSLGAVVSIYGNGEAFDVEFASPVYALLTLTSKDFRPIAEASRERVIAAAQHLSYRRG